MKPLTGADVIAFHTPSRSKHYRFQLALEGHPQTYTEVTVSTYRVDEPEEEHLELPREELLRRARPLPPREEMVIEPRRPGEGAAVLTAPNRDRVSAAAGSAPMHGYGGTSLAGGESVPAWESRRLLAPRRGSGSSSFASTCAGTMQTLATTREEASRSLTDTGVALGGEERCALSLPLSAVSRRRARGSGSRRAVAQPPIRARAGLRESWSAA
jgi:hypothetical protein